MKTALDKIKELNAKSREWVAEDPENRCAGLLTEDEAYWAECGINTYEQMEHYLLVCDVYEGTRDIWGYKPDWGYLQSLDNAELELEAKRLSEAAQVKYAEEAEEIAETRRQEHNAKMLGSTVIGDALDAALEGVA